jgi:hypothetical protein
MKEETAGGSGGAHAQAQLSETTQRMQDLSVSSADSAPVGRLASNATAAPAEAAQQEHLAIGQKESQAEPDKSNESEAGRCRGKAPDAPLSPAPASSSPPPAAPSNNSEDELDGNSSSLGWWQDELTAEEAARCTAACEVVQALYQVLRGAELPPLRAPSQNEAAALPFLRPSKHTGTSTVRPVQGAALDFALASHQCRTLSHCAASGSTFQLSPAAHLCMRQSAMMQQPFHTTLPWAPLHQVVMTSGW